MEMAKNKKRSYEIQPSGAIIVHDERQFTNGAIVPNYLIDLYLPIIGYDGLGILASLYRLGPYVQAVPNLTHHARAGGMGYRAFIGHIKTLEACGLLRIEWPSAHDRAEHKKTAIYLRDAPKSVPMEFVAMVEERTLARWLFGKTELLPDNSVQLLPSNSLGLPPDNSPELLPGNADPETELLPSNSNKEGMKPCSMKREGECTQSMPARAVMAYETVFKRTANASAKASIEKEVGDLVLWESVLEYWHAGEWAPRVPSILKCYQERAANPRAPRNRAQATARVGAPASPIIAPPPPFPGDGDLALLHAFLDRMRSKLNEESFKTWFGGVTGLALENGSLLLRASDEVRRWIGNNYWAEVYEALEEIGMGEKEIIFAA
jgi:hypothetical protein